VLLNPALVVPLKLTDFTRTAPLAIPARATTATVRVLDFMIILPFRFQGRQRPRCARARCDQAPWISGANAPSRRAITGIIRSCGTGHQPGREVCR
jgi:hypothetical protein